MKGIILAGGSGTRLYPITLAVSKQLMPIYDKPMIYYPLSTLMLAGIRDILIISTPQDIPAFQRLLGDGSRIGCSFSYAVQEKPNGLPEAYIIGESFIGNGKIALIFGDNIFYGSGFSKLLQSHIDVNGAVGFAVSVKDPERYGIYEFDKDMNVVSIEEKPEHPKSNYANAGLYFCDNEVIDIAKQLTPSRRGELEIVDMLNAYRQRGKLKVSLLNRGTVWLDTGTIQSMIQAAEFIRIVEECQGVKIGCIEEVAYRMKFITAAKLEEIAQPLIKSGYGNYLLRVLSE